MKNVLIYFFAVAVIGTAAKKDYCSLTCKDYNTEQVHIHTACKSRSPIANTCPPQSKELKIKKRLQNIIVDEHNKYRNLIAGGGHPKHNRACRMATMTWDDELAFIASAHVKKCQFIHDKCRITEKYPYAGQNGFTYHIKLLTTFKYETLFNAAIHNWYNEVQYSNQTYIDSYPDKYINPAIGHFTVMMREQNERVGCASMAYNVSETSKMIFFCNYADNNIIGSPIYNSCRNAGEHCTTGKNPLYGNLCSTNEKYIFEL